MDTLKTMLYEVTGRIARITLNRPARGNGITMDMPRELAACVERANIDPEVHVIVLSGKGNGFCGGYDLIESAESLMSNEQGDDRPPAKPPAPVGRPPRPHTGRRRNRVPCCSTPSSPAA